MADSWDDMRIFLSVARAESLSAAGRRLRMDPATVGRRIQRLEARLAAVLFVKSPQGYALTEAGARLTRHAEAAELAMQAGAEVVSGGSEGLSGQVRIGAPDGCANYVLPQVCAALTAENPDLDVQILALPRVVNLSQREADLAITVSPPSAGRLLVQKVCDYHLSLAASAGYLRRAPRIATLTDLRAHGIVGYIPDMIFDKELDYLSDAGVARVHIASNSVAVQFNAVRQGAGVGIVHDFALPSAPEVRRILPRDFRLRRAFYLVRHASDRRLDRLNRLAEAVSRRLRREITRLEGLATKEQDDAP